MRMSVPASSRWVAKLWRRVWTVTGLSKPASRAATWHAACRVAVLTGRSPVTPGEQPMRRLGQAPIGAQDREQRRREHDVAVLATLALRDADHHPAAVEVVDLECRDLGHPQASTIGRR